MELVLFFISSILILYSISKLFTKFGIRDKFELTIVTLCTYISILSLLSLLLVVIRIYSINIVSLVFFVLSLFTIFKVSSIKKENIKKSRKYKLNLTFVICILIIAAILYMGFPTEYLLGGRDTGLYAVFSYHIAKTGGLDLYDPVMEDLYKELKSTLNLGYPGIYSGYNRNLSDKPGDLIPQFLHLFPALAANAVTLFGLKGLFLLNGLITILSLAIIFLFTKKIGGIKAGLFTIILLFINPAQIWNARLTLTEPLSQLLFFFALYLLYIAHVKKNKILYIIAGIILGMGCLNRVDAFIYGVAVVVYMGYIILIDNKRTKLGLQFFFSYLIISASGFLYGYIYSYPYFHDLWVAGPLKKVILLNILSIFILVILSLLKYFNMLSFLKIRQYVFIKRRLFILIGMFFLTLLILGFYIKPILLGASIDINSYDHFKAYAVREFTWYIPLSVLLFSTIGISYICTQKNLGPTLVFLVAAIGSILGYLNNPHITPDHMWASRRWVPVVIPSLLIFASIGLEKIKTRNYFKVLLIITVLFLGLFNSLYYSKDFIFNKMLEGYGKQYELLASKIPNDSIVFTTSNQLASPLKYIYSKQVYRIKEPSPKVKEEIKNFTKKDRSVYFLGVNPANYSLSAKQILNMDLKGPYMEIVRGKYPNKIILRRYNADLYKLYSDDRQTFEWVASDLSTQIGIKKGNNSYVSNGQKGFLVFGPYIQLEKGNYELIMKGQLIKKNKTTKTFGFIDVASDKGTNIVKRKQINNIENGNVALKLHFNTDKISDAEFRLYVNEGVILRLDKICLHKIE